MKCRIPLPNKLCLLLALMLATSAEAQQTPLVTEVAASLQTAEAALESGQAEQARGLFQRLLEAQPDLLEAHLGLGRAYLALGEPSRALLELEHVLHLDNLPPDLQGQAEAYAEAAEQLMQGDRSSTSANIRLGAGRYLPGQGSNENFATLAAGAGLAYQWSNRYSFNASVEGQHRFYPDSGDTNAYRGRIGINRISGNSMTHLELSSRSRRRHSGASLNDHAISIDWQHTHDADNQFRLGARFSQVNVPDSLVGQLDRNHRAGQLSAGLVHAFADGNASISANALLGREWSRRGGMDGDASFHGLNAELNFTLSDHASVWAGGLWRHNRFRLLRPGDDAQMLVRRRDDLYEFYAGLAWQLGQDWTLSPELLYLRDRGNIASNHYSSTEITLSLRKDF